MNDEERLAYRKSLYLRPGADASGKIWQHDNKPEEQKISTKFDHLFKPEVLGREINSNNTSMALQKTLKIINAMKKREKKK